MAENPQSSSSPPPPSTNSDNKETNIYSVLLFFHLLNITITSATAIYNAHTNDDTPMIIFITFVYCGTLLLCYWFRLSHIRENSARKHNLKICVLLSFIMFGFACKLSTFMSPVQFLAFFAVVIAGNLALLYVHFIFNGGEHETCRREIRSNLQHQVSIRTRVSYDTICSSLLWATNSDTETEICCVLSFLGFLSIKIPSAVAIYHAHNNGDILMVLFITFVYFGTVLLDYWFRLYYNLPRHDKSAWWHKLKIGIWVLLIMFGFACEFSILMKPGESPAIPSVVIGGSSLLFYVYFIWNGVEDKRCEEIWSNSNSEGENRVTHTGRRETDEEEENGALLDNLAIV